MMKIDERDELQRGADTIKYVLKICFFPLHFGLDYS